MTCSPLFLTFFFFGFGSSYSGWTRYMRSSVPRHPTAPPVILSSALWTENAATSLGSVTASAAVMVPPDRVTLNATVSELSVAASVAVVLFVTLNATTSEDSVAASVAVVLFGTLTATTSELSVAASEAVMAPPLRPASKATVSLDSVAESAAVSVTSSSGRLGIDGSRPPPNGVCQNRSRKVVLLLPSMTYDDCQRAIAYSLRCVEDVDRTSIVCRRGRSTGHFDEGQARIIKDARSLIAICQPIKRHCDVGNRQAHQANGMADDEVDGTRGDQRRTLHLGQGLNADVTALKRAEPLRNRHVERVNNGTRAARDGRKRGGVSALVLVGANRPVVSSRSKRSAACLNEQEVSPCVVRISSCRGLITGRNARHGFRCRAVHRLGNTEQPVVKHQRVVDDGRVNVGTRQMQLAAERVIETERASVTLNVRRATRSRSARRTGRRGRTNAPQRRGDGSHAGWSGLGEVQCLLIAA